MKKSILFLSLLISYCSYSQVGYGTKNPHPSAIVEVAGVTGGFLMPRMNTLERNAINNPASGLSVFNLDRQEIQIFRTNAGPNNNDGWFDTSCEKDVAAALAGLPAGITLDFSDLTTNGLMFQDVGGTGTQLTSSSSNGNGVKSIGPILEDFSDPSSNLTYIEYDAGTSEPNGSAGVNNSNFRFKLENKSSNVKTSYSAGTFLKRNNAYSGSNGHFMTTDLTDYTGDFDLILVAKFNDISSLSGHSSFFNTGGQTSGFQIGCGTSGNIGFFNLNFAGKANMGSASGAITKIALDEKFHRFRVKHTAKTVDADAIVEFYVDGILLQKEVSGVNGGKISRLSLFTNRSRSRFPKSSISFLGVYPSHLSESFFQALDGYLYCKFDE